MNKDIKLVAAGFSCMDVYEKLGRSYPTGNGVDWGVHLSRMGIPVSIVSVVGDDIGGDTMKRMLTEEGMEISHLHTAHGDTCQMRMDLKNGVDRVHLEEIEGVMADFELTAEDIAYIKTFDMMHTDLFGNVLKHLKEIHDAGVAVVMDFSVFSEDTMYNDEENYRHVDYVFMSYEDESEHLLDHMKHIYSFGPKIVTATLGEKGSISYNGKQFYRAGIVPCQVVNTVGAGDSYIAGFTYGILQGWDIPECQAHGAKTSVKAITKFEPY